MDKRTVVITELENRYLVENNGITEFALIGILECILFDLKLGKGKDTSPPAVPGREKEEEPPVEQTAIIPEQKNAAPAAVQDTKRETIQAPPSVAAVSAPDLRTRIGNAVKAIKGLGGEIEDTDLGNLTDEELQAELAELTSQYKRLKSSQAAVK